VVEKCAELGATDFIPLLTERSPKLGRSNGREDRWERIAFAAMKQSLGVYAMKVHTPMQSVQDFVDQYLRGAVCNSMPSSDTEGSNFNDNDKDECRTEKRMCALMGAQGAEPLYSVLKRLHLTSREQDIREGILVVGPEGDFTAEEFERLVEAGVLPVGLGERRLRTETAAVAMLSCMVGMGMA
jgi:16S rRNA (uracil1498-N3)-methyltransferase